jgi:Domain of unknown function (DUF4280)
MPNSYVIQSANIICTNMQVTAPLKLGVSRSNPNIINLNKKEYFLTVEDRKINSSFKCKMAAKKWGGLAMLCAGLAIGGAILLCVATGGLAAPALLALAATATTAGVVIAATGVVVAIGIGLYKEAHDCDATLESKWLGFHPTVKFQKKNALLNSSTMKCNIGGMLTIIIDNSIAQKAATFISNNNAKEILAQSLSKFGVGLIGGLTGGANIPAVSIAIACDYQFEDSTNYVYDADKFNSEVGETLTEEGIALGADATQEIAEMHRVTKFNQAVTRDMIRYNTDAVNAGIAGNTSRQASRELAADIASRSYRSYNGMAALKNIGIGLGGALAGFALEQSVNVYEDNLQTESIKNSESSNKSDSGNSIGVNALKN